ncbi:hypothetical protein BJF90_13775 [Pseudonocardia sp. CNS-004]|nr:hypothetical protein BJF90_13775 [Pseudonocardia sp. CNS-004]
MTSRHPGRLAGLLAAGACLLLAACGGTPAGGDGRPLTIALSDEPTSMDPCDDQTGKNGIILRNNVVESLTDLDPDTKEVVPLLADSWTRLDPTTWTFTLRTGVTFHDGTPFDAAAAAFGINRTVDKALACLNAEQFAGGVTATALNPTTLQVVTEQPDPILPRRLSFVDLPSPKTPAGQKTDTPIGTGPYRFVERNQGIDIQLGRFDSYWGHKPDVAEARYVFRAESSVRAATAATGESDIAVGIAPQDATSDDRTRRYSENAVVFLRTQTNKPPFDDVRVRQAVAHAINKDTIVAKLMPETGKVTGQIVTDTNNGYVPGFTGPSYDPERARQLVAAAAADGVPVDTEIELVTRPLFPGSDEVVQAIAANLGDVGLRVRISTLETGAWLKFLYPPFPPEQQVNIVATLHDNIGGDAAFTFPKYIETDGCCSTIRDPVADDLINRALSAEGDERAQLFQDAASTTYERDAALVPVTELFSLVRLAPGIEYRPNNLTGTELRLAEVHRGPA